MAPPPERLRVWPWPWESASLLHPSVLLQPESAPWNTLPCMQTSRWMGLCTGSGCSLPRGRAQSPRDRTEAGAPAADPVLLSQNQNQERKGCSFQVFFFLFFKFVFTLGFLFCFVLLAFIYFSKFIVCPFSPMFTGCCSMKTSKFLWRNGLRQGNENWKCRLTMGRISIKI